LTASSFPPVYALESNICAPPFGKACWRSPRQNSRAYANRLPVLLGSSPLSGSIAPAGHSPRCTSSTRRAYAVALLPGFSLAFRWLKKNPPAFRPQNFFRRFRRPLPGIFLLLATLVFLGGIFIRAEQLRCAEPTGCLGC